MDFPIRTLKSIAPGDYFDKFVAKDMSNKLVSSLESGYRIFRSTIYLSNEEDCSRIQVLFRRRPLMKCIFWETPMHVDGNILDGDLSTFMEFSFGHKVQTSGTGRNAIPVVS